MPAPILIVGQGLAGTVLGWTLEREGIDFEIADAGHARAASRVGAGIINPVTGRRIVKSRGIDFLFPRALAAYRAMEARWGAPLVRPMRVRRFFKDDRERETFAAKRAAGELAPYAGEADADGFWIEGAARVDTAALIAAARARWLADGRLREERIDPAKALSLHDRVILCTGADDCGGRAWGGADCLRATGGILNIAVAGLAPDVILNRGHWVLPTAPGSAKVGATYSHGDYNGPNKAMAAPDVAALERSDNVASGHAFACGSSAATTSLKPSREVDASRSELEQSARDLLGGRAFAVRGIELGVRVTSPDRYPLAGPHPREPRLGIFNGLGSKGALFAPWLAHQWFNHLTEAVPFDPGAAVGRFRR